MKSFVYFGFLKFFIYLKTNLVLFSVNCLFVSVIVHFTGQLDWPQVPRLHIILDISVRVFLDEISFRICGLSKVDGFPNVSGHHLIL